MFVMFSHLTALAEAAQQQSGVGGNNAVFHVFACVLQSYTKTRRKNKNIITPYYNDACLLHMYENKSLFVYKTHFKVSQHDLELKEGN